MKGCSLVAVACGMIIKSVYQVAGINLCCRPFSPITRNYNPACRLHGKPTGLGEVIPNESKSAYSYFPNAGFEILYLSLAFIYIAVESL
jgi:hypothetical protein